MADFDWVTARNHCSVAIVFARLRQAVKMDVEKRQKISSEWLFNFISEEHSFFVSRERPKLRRVISFIETGDAIQVMDDEKEKCTATLTLTNERECRLLVNGQELEEWQFRKLALEDLFFG